VYGAGNSLKYVNLMWKVDRKFVKGGYRKGWVTLKSIMLEKGDWDF